MNFLSVATGDTQFVATGDTQLKLRSVDDLSTLRKNSLAFIFICLQLCLVME